MRFLDVKGTEAIKIIRPEFVDQAGGGAAAFSKPEYMRFMSMPNSEEWIGEKVDDGGGRDLDLLTVLESCSLLD